MVDCKTRRHAVTIRGILLALMLLPVLGWGNVVRAEKLAVIAAKGAGEILKDAEYVLQAAGAEGLGQFFLPQIQAQLQGIDPAKPIGMVVEIDPQTQQFKFLAMVPVKDLDGLLGRMQAQLGEPEDVGGGVLRLQGPGQPIFVKETNGWAFLGQSADDVKNPPANPVGLLDGLNENYTVAARVYVENVPEPFKQMAIGQLQRGMQQGLQNQNDPNAQKMAELQIKQLTQFIEETEQVTVGLEVDGDKRQLHFDLGVAALSGTKMAKQLDLAAQATTKFSAFLLPDAAIQASAAGLVPEDQVEESLAAFENVRNQAFGELERDKGLQDEQSRKLARQLVDTFFDILEGTIRSGQMDLAGSVVLKPDTLTAIAAVHVADSKKVEDALKQLVDLARNEEDTPISDVRFNADSQGGVRFHTLAIAVPEDEEIAKVVGSELKIVVGTGDKAAYLAVGTDAMDRLKELLSKSGQTPVATDPFRMYLAVTPILEFAKSIDDNPMLDAMLQMVEQAEGKDRLNVRVLTGEGEATYRFQVEEGVLRLIGGMSMGAGAQAGGF